MLQLLEALLNIPGFNMSVEAVIQLIFQGSIRRIIDDQLIS